MSTPSKTILLDTRTGEDKDYPAPVDFPKQRWLEVFKAAGLSFDTIDYVFCTDLHIDYCGWCADRNYEHGRRVVSCMLQLGPECSACYPSGV